MEMQGSDTPIPKPTPNVGHSADLGHHAHPCCHAHSGGIANFEAAACTWMEMVDTADVAGPKPAASSLQLSNLASTTMLWMEMQGTNTPTCQSSHPSPFANIAQIWLDMDSPTDVAVGSSIQQPHNTLTATTQLWLDMEIPADSSASPKAMEVDADVGADP